LVTHLSRTSIASVAAAKFPECPTKSEFAKFCATNEKSFSSRLAATINQLIHDEPRLKKMSHHCRVRAQEKFSWSNIAKATLEVYQDLIKPYQKGQSLR
jgi:hypothetical protein